MLPYKGRQGNIILTAQEIIVKDNAELIGVLEEVNAMDGVRDTVWSEIVRVVGKKRSVPSYIIDRF